MWAIVLTNKQTDPPTIESVLVIDTYEAGLDRSVSLGADLNFFDRWDKTQEEGQLRMLRAFGNLVTDEFRIDLIRAFKG